MHFTFRRHISSVTSAFALLVESKPEQIASGIKATLFTETKG